MSDQEMQYPTLILYDGALRYLQERDGALQSQRQEGEIEVR
jgi:hypothetical protein